MSSSQGSSGKRLSLKDTPNNQSRAPIVLARRKMFFTTENLARFFYPKESIDDLLNPVFYMELVVECILCAYVMCLVIWCLNTLNPLAYKPNVLHFGLFAGFFIMYVIEAYGPITGAPLNPAGVWGFFVAGRISFARTVLYTGVEIAGAAAGSMAGFYLTPEAQRGTFGALLPGEGLEPWKGMFIEAILTFNLLFVALSVTNPKSKTSNMPSFPIAFCIGVGIMAAGTHTGGLQNPLVPFGPAVCSGNFKHHWLYWVGPYIGATFGSLFYLTIQFIKGHFEHQPTGPEEENIGLRIESSSRRSSRGTYAVVSTEPDQDDIEDLDHPSKKMQ